MSSAKFGEKENSPLAVLLNRAEQESVAQVVNFFERVSAQERRLIEKWNATEQSWSDDPCLHELFEAQALNSPHAPALICGDVVLSYGELNERAQRVAVRLLEEGIARQEVIGLVADCSEDAIVGLLGILKAGGAYLPLDTTLPEERLCYFLQDAAVRVVVGKSGGQSWLADADVTFVPVKDLPATGPVRLPKVSANDLAYVLYTSGSTGKAKGVMLNHRGPVNTVRDINERFSIRSTDRVLALSSLGFDLSVYDVFGMLAVGATIVQPTPAQARDPEQWRQLIERHSISVWNTVPALMDMLVTFFDGSFVCSDLRLVMMSGDWIPVSLPERIRASVEDAQLVSLGGSTEASIWSAIYPIDQVDKEWRSIPYGSAMVNQRLYVIDSDQRLCPIGEVGELCLAGIGVAKGYLNRAELNAERFVPDPWDHSSLMYRTGDLCRYMPDGNLEFLGRRDHQVKIRGYRIGLGEIESEIARLPEVRDAAVVASEEKSGARLIAYVVFNADCSLSLEQLNGQLAHTLAEYMLPSALVVLAKLPLSANGKVDRRQLPLPAIARNDCDIQLPTTATEKMVSGILCNLLKLSQIDVRDDFYALGGHSLLAVALVCQLRNACGVQISVPQVMSKSLNTIELARLVDECSQSCQVTEGVSLQKEVGPRLGRAPLSYAQQQMWVVNFLEQNRQRYNVPLIYEIDASQPADSSNSSTIKELNVDALRFAFSQLIKRNDILRTIYVAKSSVVEQFVLPETDFDLKLVDLSGSNLQESQASFDSAAFEFVSLPFNLHEDLPIRAALYKLDSRQWRLVISIHHIAVDGLSINLIQNEIAQQYETFVSGCQATKPAHSYQYARYAVWQHEQMPPAVFETDRQYWRDILSGPLPVLDLPQDKVAENTTEHEIEGETVYLQFDQALFDSVTSFAKQRQVTPFIALLAAIKAVFYRYTGQEDIVVGTTVSTRSEQATQEMIGYFINVLPLRTRFDGNQSFAELLNSVRATVLGALTHCHYPLELLKKEILSSEAAGQDPFRVMFVLEDEPDPLQLPGLDCAAKSIDTHTAKFDLLIAAFVSANGLRFELQYRRSCFQRQRIEAFAKHLQLWLAAAVEQPEQPLNRLHWLPLTQRAQLSNAVPTLAASFLHAFAEQVACKQSSTALSFQTTRVSYAELDERSSALAAWLQQQEIGAGDRVAVNLLRSPDMVVAVLATLKAGAAYVPIDPAWPAKRREQVLQDCDPALVLTHSEMADLRAGDDTPLRRVDCDQFDTSPCNAAAYRPLASDPESDAYILYTSGSTGRPKGVAMRHAALNNLLAWQSKTSRAGDATKTLQFASLGFDVSFQEIFATLCSGGELVLVEEELQQDLNRLWKFIVSAGIERLFVPFAALRGLCEIAGGTARHASLKEVITAGEQLQVIPAVRSFFAQLPECRLWNQYGPTETHVVTAKLLEGAAQDWPSSPAIGLPIDSCDVLILDKHLQPMPHGIRGEIYLGGQCLANGYFGNAQLTNERFLKTVDEKLPGRVYRTGDLGFVDFDGDIQFVGRNDHQIKVRGHRVELSEIELALAECHGVQQAVVKVHICGAGTQLRAYLLSGQADLDVDSIAKQLADSLPSHMIPQHFCVVDHFPMTATGKVDRERLSAIAAEQVNPIAKLVSDASDDPIVARLKPIWQAVLQCDELDADSNFFDFGGDSLAAAILFSRMEAEFGRAVSIDTLVKCPTMRKLAEVYRVESAVRVSHWDKLAPLQPLGSLSPIICLPGIDGHFLNFRHMANMLGEDRPMFGLQPVGLNGIDAPLVEIADIAADHVQTLQAAMPQGPYNLVGFSFGGMVAYEMAQILRRRGEQVALALIDCSTGVPMTPSLVQSIAFHFRYARQMTLSRRWQYLLERIRGYWLGIQFKLKLIDWERRLEGLIDVKGHYSRVAAVNMQALSRYRPTTAEGPAVLYRATLRANWPGKDRTDPATTWLPLFGDEDLQVVDIEGAHANVMSRPNVDKLVKHLGTILH